MYNFLIVQIRKNSFFYGVFRRVPRHNIIVCSKKMKEYINIQGQYFYIPFIRDALVLISLILCIKNVKKNNPSFIFIYYLIYYLLNISQYIFQINHPEWLAKLYKIELNYLTLFVESFIYSYYIRRLITSNLEKKVIFYTTLLFSSFFIFYYTKFVLIYENLTMSIVFKTQIYECVFILFISSLYLKNLLTRAPNFNLLKEPSFWIVSGITFTILGVLPTISILSSGNKIFSGTYKISYSIYILFYCLNIVMLTKGFLCKPTIIKH